MDKVHLTNTLNRLIDLHYNYLHHMYMNEYKMIYYIHVYHIT